MRKVSMLLAVLLLLNVIGLGAFSSVLAANPPRAPEGLEAKAVSDLAITLSWSDRSNNETGFIIERSTAENGDYLQIGNVGRNEKVFSDKGLAPSTTYWYRVKARNDAGVSEPSAAVSATTFLFPPSAPTAPAGLNAAAATSTQINLSWIDASDNETGFKIERTTSSGDFQQIAIVGANATSFADTGLFPGVAYTYRIKAYNAGGDSDYSNTASTVTGGVPSAPKDLQAVASGTQIKLIWTDTSDNEDGFKIERKAGGGGFVQIDAVKANSTAYTDTGLSAGVLYAYRVRAYNAAGDSGYSAEASSALEVAPASPSNLDAVPVSKYQIKLTWADNSNNETGFKIERRTAGGSYAQIDTVDKNTLTYTDSWLSPGKTYYYRVRAYNSIGNSSYSSEAGTTTAVPAAPSNLDAVTLSSTSIKLTWADNSDNETGFKIERKNYRGSYAQVGTAGANDMAFTDAGLTPNTTYYYRIRAYNSLGNSAYCNEISTVTIYLAAPSKLTAETASSSQINLSWADNSNNESGFKIERKVSGGSYAQIAAVSQNAVSYVDKGLKNNTVYHYRVRAYNYGGNSAYSNESSATTGAIPATPSNLTAEAVSPSKVTLSWKDNAGNETGFKIERKVSGGSYVQIATLGANVRSYSDTGLSPNTVYYYRVRAYNAVGNSPYSNEVAVSAGIPVAPSKLTATAVSEKAIMLTWVDNASNESGFKIERKTSGGNYAQVALTGANTEVYYDNDLNSGTIYHYRIRAYNSAGNSPYSGEAKAATAAEPQKVIVLNAGKTTYYVDNQRRVMDTVPIITEGRTFLPIRYVAEPLGAALGWDGAQQKVTITFKGKVIELWIGSNAARVDGKLVNIDPDNPNIKPLIVPPGRTMLPLRFVSENLGCKVDWDPNSQQITVTYPKR